MTINEIIEENRQLQLQLSKAINTIAALERKVAYLQKENTKLKEENEKLRKQKTILERAIEIALKIPSKEKQDLHLSMVLKKLKEEFK